MNSLVSSSGRETHSFEATQLEQLLEFKSAVSNARFKVCQIKKSSLNFFCADIEASICDYALCHA